jgi:putative hydrolase of the HAD superfamily
MALGGMTPRAVLLDSFGTLVAMDPPAFHLRDELARRGLEVEPSVAAEAFRAEIAYYLEHHTDGRDRESLDELRDRCARVMSRALGDPPIDVRAAMLASLRFVPFPDVPRALRDLRARGLRAVVASNWDCSLGEVLREAGLRDLVDGVVTSAEAGAAKPDPRLFESALEVAGCGPAEAVYVGDSPANDVGGAAAAGMRAILVERHGQRPDRVPADSAPGPEPAARIGSLAELPSVLFDG